MKGDHDDNVMLYVVYSSEEKRYAHKEEREGEGGGE